MSGFFTNLLLQQTLTVDVFVFSSILEVFLTNIKSRHKDYAN